MPVPYHYAGWLPEIRKNGSRSPILGPLEPTENYSTIECLAGNLLFSPEPSFFGINAFIMHYIHKKPQYLDVEKEVCHNFFLLF